MGAGIIFSHEQVAEIIKRDLIKDFNIEQANKCPYTIEGYAIYEDFTDEEILRKKIKEINRFVYFT
jgi:hypothetical protein